MTNKITKELYETHAKRLSAIINAQSQFAPFLNKAEFSSILKIELNALAVCEKIFSDSKLEEKYTAEYLAKTFIDITKQEWNLDKDYKYDDESDIIDTINYLPKYCFNIFKTNLDDLVEGKKVNVEQPNINFKDKEPVDGSAMDAANAFNLGAMGFGGMSNYDNPLLAGKAFAKLRDEFSKGNVYQFKTKPRLIPIVKIVLSILLFLGVFAALGTSIVAFMLNKVSIKSGEETFAWSTIADGMFYIILAGFLTYTLVMTMISLIKGKMKKNDNLLYSFNWAFYLSSTILQILIYLLNIGIWTSTPNFVNITSAQQTAFNIWRLMVIVGPSIGGLTIIPMVIGALKAPKIDNERIEQLVHQYIDEMVGSAPSSGADVQKPVDVKPTDVKPTEENKQSEEQSAQN